MTRMKKKQQIRHTVIAKAGEWNNTTYVPVINVNIIPMTETIMRTVDAAFSFDTWSGSSYIVEK